MRLVVGISGASGVIYGIRLLQVLSKIKGIEIHLVITEEAEHIINYETDWKIKDIKALADVSYDIRDLGAPISSGSYQTDAVIIAPCSIKTMSALANSYAENLLIRAGDVALKERRKLILLVRETPFHVGHLRMMYELAGAGAIIMPPIPAFYIKPQTIQDLIDYTVGKVLDVLGIEHNLFRRWSGSS